MPNIRGSVVDCGFHDGCIQQSADEVRMALGAMRVLIKYKNILTSQPLAVIVRRVEEFL